MKHLSEWEEAHTRAVAGEIHRLQSERGISAEALASKVSAHGVIMSRTMIVHLYSGRRKLLDVTEVIAFARALDVPLMQLIYPGEPERWVAITAADVGTVRDARQRACEGS